MVEKVTRNFSNYEQQLFLSSFYCYLQYDYKTDYVIDLDNIWSWLGFSQKYNAKYLLQKNFTIKVDYIIIAPEGVAKIIAPEPSGAKKTPRGGHNKETIMLNVDTFKKMCMKAGTKKADEIHDYFIKLEKVLQETLYEESNDLKLQLEQQKTEETKREDKQKKEYEIKLEQQKVLEKEKILLREYGTIGAIFYIIKVKTWENKQYVIKIGESRRGIADRYKEHKSKYEECVLLDCFAVERSRDFETFIKDHDYIRPNKFKTLEGHENELELLLIGKNLTYQTLINIINHNIKYFNNDTGKLQLENERLQLLLEMKSTNNDNLLIHELIKTVKQLSAKIDNLEKINKEVRETITTVQPSSVAPPRVLTGFQDPLKTVGPRLQKINPETLTLVKVYETVTELMNEDSRIKRPSLNKAVVENTVYCGFRWLLVDREIDPSVIGNISPTKPTKVQNLGYIAQINKDQTAIVNVFLDRKTAARLNGYESISALDLPVKNFTLSNGYYYKLYEECDVDHKILFEEEINGSPLLYKNGVGQYDSDNNLQKEFICKYDCLKQLKMSDKTLTKAMDKNLPYNGFFYRTLPEKLKCR
jgi:phage anti-repressor protein